MHHVHTLMPTEVAHLYQENILAADAIPTARRIIAAVHESARRRLRALPWLDARSRALAQAKLSQLRFMIGVRPADVLRARARRRTLSVFDTGGLSVFGAHVVDVRLRSSLDVLAEITVSGVRPAEWARAEGGSTQPFSALSANAAYVAEQNTLFVPAPMLQSPIFSPHLPLEHNFGAFGVLVGHEISHGFDERGQQYDASGWRVNATTRWTDSVVANFAQRAQCLAGKYAHFKFMVSRPGQWQVTEGTVSGRRTLNEDIADFGGLTLAYSAWLTECGGECAVPQQHGFFRAFGQVFCGKHTSENVLKQLNTDVHAPEWVRVNAAVDLFEPFQTAYACLGAGSETRLLPPSGCVLW